MADAELKTTKKTRTRIEAVPQLADLPERVGILETKLEFTVEKIDDLKADVRDMHDCLDRTRDGIMVQLESMHKSSCEQHSELADKISSLEKAKHTFTLYLMIALAFAAGAGWIHKMDAGMLLKFLGL